MNRKLFLTLFLLLMTTSSCFAETMKVMSLNDFSTDEPSEIRVKVLETMKLDNDIIIEEGSIVTGKMVDVIPAKRLKRDATFSFKPTSFITPKNEMYNIHTEYVGKFSPKFELDKKDLAKSAALSVGNHLMQGFAMGVHAVEGAIKDEKGNRIVSSVNNVYENSFLSYIEKGGATCIKAESYFSFKFPDPEGEGANKEGVNKAENANQPNMTKAPEIYSDIPGFEKGSLPASKK